MGSPGRVLSTASLVGFTVGIGCTELSYSLLRMLLLPYFRVLFLVI